jgi:hypothetical protein
MKANHHPSEKGQAIVYLVIGIVVFLGFVALAIDGGMALADGRHAQNGADSASLAGGGTAAKVLDSGTPVCISYWTCDDADAAESAAESAAINRAASNEFTIDTNIDDHNGVDVTCNNTGKYIDVTVDISTTTTSNFLQLVFPSALHNEVDAVTRVYPRQPIGLDDAVIGLNTGSCAENGGYGVTVSGNGDTIVTGGNIFSNGCMRGNGNAGSANVVGGAVYGHELLPGNLTWNPEPAYTDRLIQPEDYIIDPEIDLDAQGNCIGGTTYRPNQVPSTIGPGLVCIKGNWTINSDLTGTDVTIYMLNGNITYNGNASVNITAPTDTNASPEIPGIWLYVPNGGAVTLNGTSSDNFVGMIYAPKSDIKLEGNAENIFEGQVIGWNVNIGGTNDMQVHYNNCTAYTRSPWIKLYK